MTPREMILLTLSDGRQVDLDDTGRLGPDAPTVVWHRGSPHTGALFEPLLGLARDTGVRMVSVARPAYARSTRAAGRTVAEAAADTLEVVDRLGIEPFAVMGESGGGPHALASAALAPDRVVAAAVFASVAPYRDEPAWWGGMASDGGLRSAVVGPAERMIYGATDEWNPEIFVDTDYAALEGTWAGLGEDAGASGAAGVTGLADDDLAFVRPWGIDVADVVAPVLLVHGRRDRVIPPMHATLLERSLPDATVWWRDDAGHVAVLDAVPDALAWVLERLRA